MVTFALSLRVKIGVALVLVSSAFAVGGVLAYRSVVELIETSRSTEQTHDVLTELGILEARLIDLENGQRGFLLNGDESYLKPYLDSSIILYTTLDAVTTLTAENAKQQAAIAKLRELASARHALLDRSIALNRAQPRKGVTEIARTDEGKRLMDEIRATLLAMGAEEYRLLDQRRAQAQRSLRRSLQIGAAGGFVLLLLLVLVAFLIRDDLAMRAQLQETVLRMAYHDSLTGLPNRAALEERLHGAIARARRNSRLMAVLYFDLDGFKAANDRHGHQAGDELLQEIGRRVSGILRDADTLARLGGDEFVVLLEEITEPEGVNVTARKILAEVARPFVASRNRECRVTASIGISLYPRHGDDAETLVRHADAAMYEVKSHGKSGFRFYEGATTPAG